MPLYLNPWATLVAAIVAFLLGALWYSPVLFAKQWVTAHGYTAEKVQQMQKGATRAYAVSFLCFLLIALALGALASGLGIGTLMAGLKLGIAVWFGFMFPLGLMANLYSDKRLSAFLIDTSYQLWYMAIMGAIIGAWR
jgi:hypothetical protein